MARARFEAAQANPQQLARARLETARAGLDAEMQSFVAGKTSHRAVLAWSRRLLEAESAVAGGKGPPLAALGAYWLRAWEVERIVQGQYEAGRVPLADYAEARWQRLQAEIAWVREARGQAVTPAGGPLAALPAETSEDRLLARAALKAAQADLGALARLRLQAAGEVIAERWKEFVSAKISTEPLLVVARQVLEAEQAAHDQPEAGAFLEELWRLTRDVDEISRAKYEAGRDPLSQQATAAYFRFDAELSLVKMRSGKDKHPGVAAISLSFRVPDEPTDPEEDRNFARARFEANGSDPAALAKARLEAAHTAFEERRKEFIAGKTTEAFIVPWLPRLLEAERAVLGARADAARLLADRWALAWEIEEISQAKHTAGAIPVTSYLLARYARLDAELAWLQAARQPK
jgi:hypothetical protein